MENLSEGQSGFLNSALSKGLFHQPSISQETESILADSKLRFYKGKVGSREHTQDV